MALADYRLCDVCGGKAFYDANLNYNFPDKNGNGSWGIPVEESDMVRDTDYRLDYVGDWAVICTDCAKTHKVVVVALPPPPKD